MILDTFPSAEDFYKTYWGKKPFIVRGFIPLEVINALIDGDSLAGLALEEDVRSRIITNTEDGGNWSCEHGPFDDNRFDDIGDKNWSLLVQNVEQYHTDTAQLLSHFGFSPRWLIDDIMVSFSSTGGNVGPHTDSYHTFLVQGMGKRAWKISPHKIDDDRYADNLHMKVLQNGFEGETFEVTAGDVIYMPPFFGHEGTTIEPAMTFSVGFLGPKLSEMLGEYAQYLEENEDINKRYLGETLDSASAAFSIGAQSTIQKDALASLQSDDFAIWMASYFSTPSHNETNDIDTQDNPLSVDALLSTLQSGASLTRPEHIKLAITNAPNGDFNLAVYGDVIRIPAAQSHLIQRLNQSAPVTINDIDTSKNKDEIISLITALYNKNVFTLIEADR